MSEPHARITADPIDETSLRDAVAADDCGALLVFHGIVRDHDGGRGVSALDYRAHPDAERFLRECVAAETEAARQRAGAEGGVRLAAVHRVGALRIGDTALVAAAASAHRGESFAALERLVERIKREVPIWKRQHFSDGVSEWVGL